MKRIILYGRDPGAVNVLVSVYQKLNKEKFELLVYGKDYSLRSFKGNGIEVQDIRKECKTDTEEGIFDFLREKQPDFILTGTSMDDNTERYLWNSAKKLGIKTAVILDQWINIGIRFSPYNYREEELYEKEKIHPFLPDKILVMDQIAKESLEKDGISPDLIEITGQPHFDTVLRRYEEAVAIQSDFEWTICYVSEPISQDYDNDGKAEPYWGYDEKSNFRHLYRMLEKISPELQGRIHLIIRPHPRERKENWTEIVKNCNSEKIILSIDTKSSSFALLKGVDLVCGMSSMFLLEAVICGKPIISIQIGLKRKNPFILPQIRECCIREMEKIEEKTEHSYRMISDHQILLRTQLTEDDLEEALRKFFYTKKEQISFPFQFIRNASEHVSAYIEKEME